MKFCSNCGNDQLQYLIPPGDHRERYVCPKCHTIHYQNPLVVVGCLVVYQGKILLCRRSIEPQSGLWNLPAGFMENGERAEDGAQRETYEESMAKVEIVKLHALFSLPQVNQVYLHFLATMKEPHFETTPESSEVKLFSPEDIPWDDIAFESSRFALKKYLEHGPDYQGVHVGSYLKREKWMDGPVW